MVSNIENWCVKWVEHSFRFEIEDVATTAIVCVFFISILSYFIQIKERIYWKNIFMLKFLNEKWIFMKKIQTKVNFNHSEFLTEIFIYDCRRYCDFSWILFTIYLHFVFYEQQINILFSLHFKRILQLRVLWSVYFFL